MLVPSNSRDVIPTTFLLDMVVMEKTKQVLEDDHPDTLTSIANLASTYRNQGHWKEAETLDVVVMEKRKQVLGDDHPDTLASVANLASARRGRWHSRVWSWIFEEEEAVTS